MKYVSRMVHNKTGVNLFEQFPKVQRSIILFAVQRLWLALPFSTKQKPIHKESKYIPCHTLQTSMVDVGKISGSRLQSRNDFIATFFN